MKKLFVTFGVILLASMARASYLYWQLDSTPDNSSNLVLKDNTGKEVTVWGLGVGEDGNAQPTEVTSLTSGQAYYIAEDSSVSSYYIEYYNEKTDTTETTASLDRSEFVKYNDGLDVTVESLGEIGDVAPIWHTSSGTMSAAPEPTSGLLLLFGAAMLGLKRKNRSRA